MDFTWKVENLNALKHLVLTSPLDDINLAVAINRAHGIEHHVAFWVVRELRGARQREEDLLSQLAEAKSRLVVLEAMQSNKGN